KHSNRPCSTSWFPPDNCACSQFGRRSLNFGSSVITVSCPGGEGAGWGRAHLSKLGTAGHPTGHVRHRGRAAGGAARQRSIVANAKLGNWLTKLPPTVQNYLTSEFGDRSPCGGRVDQSVPGVFRSSGARRRWRRAHRS